MSTILHLGLGAFHRAHQAAFVHDAGGWSIEAVSMRSSRLADALAAQGHRYHLLIRDPGGPVAKRIDAIRATRARPGHAQAVAARMADPDVGMVTLTITEKGYDGPTPLLVADGLDRRRRAGLPPIAVLSCDNLPANGAALRARVEARASPAARGYLADCAFPSSMVDRITPATTQATIDAVERLTGLRDPCAVETEPFRQWVVERFDAPRPDWTAAGVETVADVAPWEAMKLRLLNGAHSTLAYAGALAGLSLIRDAVADPVLAALARAVMAGAARTLPPGPDSAAYAEALMRRFANPAIDHRLLQIATDGSQKLPQRLLAPAAEGAGAAHAFAVAAWLVFLGGRAEDGAALPLDDPEAARLRGAHRAADLRAVLPRTALADAAFAEAVDGWAARIRLEGVRPAARALLNNGG